MNLPDYSDMVDLQFVEVLFSIYPDMAYWAPEDVSDYIHYNMHPVLRQRIMRKARTRAQQVLHQMYERQRRGRGATRRLKGGYK